MLLKIKDGSDNLVAVAVKKEATHLQDVIEKAKQKLGSSGGILFRLTDMMLIDEDEVLWELQDGETLLLVNNKTEVEPQRENLQRECSVNQPTPKDMPSTSDYPHDVGSSVANPAHLIGIKVAHQCQHCDFSTASSRRLHSHMSLLHTNIRTCGNCGKGFHNASSFRSHIHRKHAIAYLGIASNDYPLEVQVQETDNTPRELPLSVGTDVTTANEVVVLYVRYAGERAVPETTVRDMLLDMVDRLHCFDNKQHLRRLLTNPASFDDYLVEHHLPFIPPRLVQYVPNSSSNVTYVPFKENLQSLLKCDGVLNEVFETNLYIRSELAKMSPTLCHFVHGEEFSRYHDSFLSNENIILIHLYSDEYGTCNPLGSKAAANKLFALYFVIANVRPELHSQLRLYGLILQAKSEDVLKFGLSAVLEPFLSDWRDVETNGFLLGEDRYKVRFLYMPEDNLAAHQVGGFSKSFISFRSSRFCLISRPQLKEVFSGNECIMRTKDQYDMHLARVLQDPSLRTTYGIEEESPLHGRLSDYHPISSLPPDLMHDLLEGIVPTELSLILKSLVGKRIFTLHEVNEKIKNFPFSCADKTDKPGLIRKGMTFRGKAAQSHCFLRLFGLIFGVDVVADDEHWCLEKSLLAGADIITIVSSKCTQAKDLDRFPDSHFPPSILCYVNSSSPISDRVGNSIVDVLFMEIQRTTMYPTKADIEDICEQIVLQHPTLRDAYGSGHASWARKLQFKMQNERKKLPPQLRQLHHRVRKPLAPAESNITVEDKVSVQQHLRYLQTLPTKTCQDIQALLPRFRLCLPSLQELLRTNVPPITFDALVTAFPPIAYSPCLEVAFVDSFHQSSLQDFTAAVEESIAILDKVLIHAHPLTLDSVFHILATTLKSNIVKSQPPPQDLSVITFPTIFSHNGSFFVVCEGVNVKFGGCCVLCVCLRLAIEPQIL